MKLDPIRKAAVSGQFYPSDCRELMKNITHFNQEFEKIDIPSSLKEVKPRAIIVPHAGYIYSGFTANTAYRFLHQAEAKRIIVIGPSHRYYFKGISGAYYEKYETPCGSLPIDSAYLFALAKEFNIIFEPKAHQQEHSTEVQMPFIRHYFPDTEIIELVYSDMAVKSLAKIITALLHNPENLVVISSDLSHFHNIDLAKRLDNICLKAIETQDIVLFDEGCEACGLIGIKALILASQSLELTSTLLDYRTSADASGDDSSVVGYLSAMFY